MEWGRGGGKNYGNRLDGVWASVAAAFLLDIDPCVRQDNLSESCRARGFSSACQLPVSPPACRSDEDQQR
jgi:hypothetical protein